MEGLIVLLVMVMMMFISVPVAFAMIATSIFVYAFIAHIPLGVVVQNMFYSIQPYSYSAAPYFILAGNIMARGTLAKKLLDIADACVGFFPSGLAIATVIGCALFGSITGSDIATLAAIGGIMYPALISRGWSKAFVGGILGPSALLGMLIPPTIPGLIYALVAEVSVMKVFLSGVLPAIIIVILFSIYIYFKGKKFFPDQKFQKPDFLKMIKSIKNGMTALGMPIIIFGGIYGGIFTVTEAAAVAAAYAVCVELFIHRGLKFRQIPMLAVETGITTSVVLILVSGASVLARYLSLEQIPQLWAEQIFGMVRDKWIFMLFNNLFLLVTGCLVDVLSATVILVPILKQLYIKFSIDEIYFASVFLLNLYIGFLTPPVGVNIFVVSGMFKISFADTCKSYVPYFFMLVFTLILVTLFPWLSTWLPNLFSR
ncbi:MAG: TRAP transporter large permease [Syntrophaceae bacterium]|nr:TRAP transporter large permease [Syntrophaceae bacterium]